VRPEALARAGSSCVSAGESGRATLPRLIAAHLGRFGFFVAKKPPIAGVASIGRGHEAP